MYCGNSCIYHSRLFRERRSESLSPAIQAFSVLLPERRDRVFVRRVFDRKLPFRLVLPQLGQPVRHMLQPRLGQAGEVHEKTPRFPFEAMFELVVVEPVSRHPRDTRGSPCGFVSRLSGVYHVSHCGLFAEPAEILFRVREWVGDGIGQEIEG